MCGVITEKKMDNKASDPNMEWKKSGFDKNEKVTLKINVKEANLYEAKNKRNVQTAYSPMPTDLPKGLKKIRSKIRDVFDEDEDEDENITAPLSPNMIEEENSLLGALRDDEKKFLKQQQDLTTIKSQQMVEKTAALAVADRAVKEIGLKGLKKETIAQNELSVEVGKDTLNDALKKDLGGKMKLQWKQLSEKEMIQFLRGIKRIKSIGGDDAVVGMKIDEVINAGGKKTEDETIAQMILEKSGRKEKDENKLKSKKTKSRQSNKEIKNKVMGKSESR